MGVPQRAIVLPFTEKFFSTVDETSDPNNSNSYDWQLTSGGYYDLNKGVLRVNQVDLPSDHKWAKAYATNVDAEGGAHPENIARIISRQSDFQNFTLSSTFQINRVSLSDSPNRTGDKGLFHMVKYNSQDDLYYCGIRLDGDAVIKRKAGSVYSTLAQIKWWPGEYDKTTHPCLIPVGVTIGLKTIVKSINGVTSLTFFVTEPGTTRYIPVLTVSDNYPALSGPGKIGFRGDFLSWQLDDISIT